MDQNLEGFSNLQQAARILCDFLMSDGSAAFGSSLLAQVPRLLKAGWSRKVGKRSLVLTSSVISRCSVITEVFVLEESESFFVSGILS